MPRTLEQKLSNNSAVGSKFHQTHDGDANGTNHDTPKKPTVPNSLSNNIISSPSPSPDDVARDAYKQQPRRMSIPLSTKLPQSRGSSAAGRKSRDASPGQQQQQSFDAASSNADESETSASDDDDYDDDDDDVNPREKLSQMSNSTGKFNDFCVRNMKLVSYGRRAIEVAESEMPAILRLRELYGAVAAASGSRSDLILSDAKVVVCLHVVAQTAVLIETLVKLGASIRVCACNVFSTQDEVAAALAEAGIPVFAWKDESETDYWWCIEKCVKSDNWQPNLILDDGGDATSILLQRYPNTMRLMKGVAETSLTGIHRLYKYVKDRKLTLPAVNLVDGCITRSKFENLYCTREAIVECLKRTTGAMLSGKTILIVGYGQVGKSAAQALHDIGANVAVAEIDPICALQACMEGYHVGTIDELAPRVNIVITCTGNRRVITRYHMNRMANNTLLCNMGATDREIDVDALRRDTTLKWERIKPQVDHIKWPDGKTLILIAEGRVASASCSNIPSQALSVTAAAQLLALVELLHAPEGRYSSDIYLLPKKFDELVARVHVESMGASLTELTEEQAKYLGLDKDGPYKPAHYRY